MLETLAEKRRDREDVTEKTSPKRRIKVKKLKEIVSTSFGKMVHVVDVAMSLGRY